MKKKLVIICSILLVTVLLTMCGCTDLFTTKRNYYTINESDLENLSVAEIVANNTITSAVSVVTIKRGENNASVVGAGFVITADGYVVTNDHVINPSAYSGVALEYQVKFVDGTIATANYVAGDADIDIGILKIDAAVASVGHVPYLQIAEGELKFGQTVFTIGNPDNLGLVFSIGCVANPSFKLSNENKKEDNYGILLDMNVNHGNSGGVLLNNKGAVVGVISSRIESLPASSTTNGVFVNEIYGLGVAIKVSTLVSYLEKCGITYTKYTEPEQ